MEWYKGVNCPAFDTVFAGDFIATGTVTRFSRITGSGLIKPDDGSDSMPVYMTAVQKAGLYTLDDGQRVQYELVESRSGKVSAGNLKVI